MKSVVVLAVPPGVVTVILPVVEVLGTVAVMLVDDTLVNTAGTPLKATRCT